MHFHLTLSKTFWLTPPPPPTSQKFKHSKLQNKKIRPTASVPHWFSTEGLKYYNGKANKTLRFLETIPNYCIETFSFLTTTPPLCVYCSITWNITYLISNFYNETLLTFHFWEAMQHNFVLEFHIHPQNSMNPPYDLSHVHHVLKNVKGATTRPAIGGRGTEYKD